MEEETRSTGSLAASILGASPTWAGLLVAPSQEHPAPAEIAGGRRLAWWLVGVTPVLEDAVSPSLIRASRAIPLVRLPDAIVVVDCAGCLKTKKRHLIVGRVHDRPYCKDCYDGALATAEVLGKEALNPGWKP